MKLIEALEDKIRESGQWDDWDAGFRAGLNTAIDIIKETLA